MAVRRRAAAVDRVELVEEALITAELAGFVERLSTDPVQVAAARARVAQVLAPLTRSERRQVAGQAAVTLAGDGSVRGCGYDPRADWPE